MLEQLKKKLSGFYIPIFLWAINCFLMTGSVLAAPLAEGDFSYTVDGGEATIIAYFGEDVEVLIIPSRIGGYPVTAIGDGIQTVFSNNKTRGIMLFPDSVNKISRRAIYDYNDTYFFSIPGNVTTIENGATSSIAVAKICSDPGTEAERYAKQIEIGFSSEGVDLSVSAGRGGRISNAGIYRIPGTLEKAYELTYTVQADTGYRIDRLQVNGSMVAAKGKTGYELVYCLKKKNTKDIRIHADFYRDTNIALDISSRTAETGPAADEVADAGAAAGKYTNAIGVCGGKYYVHRVNGKSVFYELVETYNSFDVSGRFKNKADVKVHAASSGLVFGRDYDYIHLYNYNDPTDTDRGAYQDGKSYYVAYLYKTVSGGTEGLVADVGSLEQAANGDVLAEATAGRTTGYVFNTSGVFAQNGGEVTLKDFTTRNYSIYYGATEGTNFYGANSAVLADSGGIINLVNPTIEGLANSAFSTYSGVINFQGGRILVGYTGAHGPYVAYGGKIYINTTEGTDAPTLADRPDPDTAGIVRNKKTRAVTATGNPASDITVVITTDEASTALATDTGGGIIVADRVLTKTYGTGSGGVYSIGSDEGLVWVTNSTLISYFDSGLVSASGGYINVYNTDIQGVMGIKTRAHQNHSTMSEVRVRNSRVTAFYDPDEMQRIYDVATPGDIAASGIMSRGEEDFLELNIYVNKRNQFGVKEGAKDHWYGDGYATTPGGAGGGSDIAVIYTEGSKTPIYVDATRLVNKNYQVYGNIEGSRAKNLIVASGGNGTCNVFFINENSRTRWDLTGKIPETTEIVGDFKVCEPSETGMDMMPHMDAMGGGPEGMPGGQGPGGQGLPGGAGPGGMQGGMNMEQMMKEMSQKGNYLNAAFENSEWEGTVIGVSENANLTFDGASTWRVTGDTTIDTLKVAPGTVITADKPVTIASAELVVAGGGKFKFGNNVTHKIVERKERD